MKQTIIVVLALLTVACNGAPEDLLGLGERADWLRGSWGINWKPAKRDNGIVETLSADAFLDQIAGLRTLDYVQLHLNESYTSSPVHWGPLAILESLWQGDTDAEGKPINLVVPRAAAGVDPFLNMLKAVKAAGLKTQVYVNSSNMLERGDDLPDPDDFPYITARWVEGVDFWDPEGDAITDVPFTSTEDGLPSCLTLEGDRSSPRNWQLRGIPTDVNETQYEFRLRVEHASGGRYRWVRLKVNEEETPPPVVSLVNIN